MAKESGLGMTLSVEDTVPTARAIEDDNLSLEISTPRGIIPATGIDSSGVERIMALADATITMNGLFDDATNKAHAVFKTIPTNSTLRAIVIVHSGQTLTIAKAALTDYSLSRAQDGTLSWTVPGLQASTTVPTWS